MKSLLDKVGVILIGLIIVGYSCSEVDIANAQCAWVLWKHVDNNINATHSWELIKAFPEHKQCIQRQQQEFESDKSTLTTHSDPSRRMTLIKGDVDSYAFYRSSDRAEIIIKLMCLPDTVDPRK